MNKQKSLELIKILTEAPGISGFEDDVVEVLKSRISNNNKLETDSMLNLYAYNTKNTGYKPVLQLDCHTDEVGFMVQAIKPNGTLKIIPIGSWVNHNIPAHKVWVRNKYGEYLTGIITSTPPHFLSEAQKNSSISMDDISVDMGVCSKEELVDNLGIRVGAPVVPAVNFQYNEANDIMISKAFDNRIGCAAVVDTLKLIENEDLDLDIVATFSSQEEVGTRGSKLNSKRTDADICIVFEGCPADDTSAEGYMVQTALKKGPMLRHIDKTMITNPRYQRFALDVAEKYNIPVQEAVRSGGGTNAAAIHMSNNGVPCIVIGVPVRYAHTHYGICSYQDYENAVKLAIEIIKELNLDIISNF